MKLHRLIAWILLMTLLTAILSLGLAEENGTLWLPSSLQIVKEEAFLGAADLDRVVVPEGTISIGSRAFADSSVKQITLPASLTEIAEDAFSGCVDLTVVAPKNSFAYDWAVERGYLDPNVSIGPAITRPAWNSSGIQADIAVYKRSNQGDADDIWWWDFCREYFKIDFNVIQVTSASDYKSTAFMGGDMPDVFYQMFISANQQTEMGDLNGLLLNMEPYMTPSLMPNLTRIFEALPHAKGLLSTKTGAIYSLGAFNNPNSANMGFYINKKWLNDAGLSVPATLNEFEAALAAFKARGDDVVPMGGDYGNCPRYLANALGWVTNSASYLTSPALYGSHLEPEFIYGNREMFPIFLQYMNKWYDAGYFSSKLFSSMEAGEESNELKAKDKVGFEQSYSGVVNRSDWVSAPFLTSQWNSSARVGRTYNAINNQSFSLAADISSESKIRHLMQWCDWHYNTANYQLSHYGPGAADTEWLFDLKSGWTATRKNGSWEYTCAEVEEGLCSSFGVYQNMYVQGIIGGYVGLCYDVAGSSSSGSSYIVDPYPQITFLSLEEIEKISSMSREINSYVNGQFAAFVTGSTAISDANLASYFDHLDSLGFQEYQKIYADYYYSRFASN